MSERAMIRLTASEMRAGLRKRYAGTEWALMFEVRNAAGFDATRSADAVAMSLWPSRGLELHGIEIKVSRSDWRNERKKPEKAEAVASFCDRWWVAAPTGVVPIDEVPLAWGLMEFDGAKWSVAREAQVTEAQPMTRSFLAALLRRGSAIDANEIGALVAAQIKDKEAAIERRIEERVKHATQRHRELEASVKAFQEASGIEITGWRGGEPMGKAVNVIEALGVNSVYGGAFHVAEQMENSARRIREALDAAGFEPPKQRDLDLPKPRQLRRGGDHV